ncbi:hypothetical protein [Paraburkholderia sediminicola]|uniref:hypothetical protein n=1 Tax=Paraburkholderia sediminicola TaxID=458836 RepID=UPI0038B98F7C
MVGRHWAGVATLIAYFLVGGTVGTVVGVRIGLQKGKRKVVTTPPHARNIYATQLARMVKGLFLCFCITFLCTPALGIVLALPAVVGEAAALYESGLMVKDSAKGCEKATGVCIEIVKDGKTIATGFRIAQSKDQIVVYHDGQTLEFELTGKEVRAMIKPMSLD